MQPVLGSRTLLLEEPKISITLKVKPREILDQIFDEINVDESIIEFLNQDYLRFETDEEKKESVDALCCLFGQNEKIRQFCIDQLGEEYVSTTLKMLKEHELIQSELRDKTKSIPDMRPKLLKANRERKELVAELHEKVDKETKRLENCFEESIVLTEECKDMSEKIRHTFETRSLLLKKAEELLKKI